MDLGKITGMTHQSSPPKRMDIWRVNSSGPPKGIVSLVQGDCPAQKITPMEMQRFREENKQSKPVQPTNPIQTHL